MLFGNCLAILQLRLRPALGNPLRFLDPGGAAGKLRGIGMGAAGWPREAGAVPGLIWRPLDVVGGASRVEGCVDVAAQIELAGISALRMSSGMAPALR